MKLQNRVFFKQWLVLKLLFTACSKKVDKETPEDISETYELTHGKSLKIGDCVQLGNYQVEDEGYSPILCYATVEFCLSEGILNVLK